MKKEHGMGIPFDACFSRAGREWPDVDRVKMRERERMKLPALLFPVQLPRSIHRPLTIASVHFGAAFAARFIFGVAVAVQRGDRR